MEQKGIVLQHILLGWRFCMEKANNPHGVEGL